jgi:nucleoside-diphosphate-sugar epimerase
MLTGSKILFTGPAGRIGFNVARTLARDNEVWGVARFSNPAEREELEAVGVKTHRVDLMTCDFSGLPRDFDYLIHFAANFADVPFDVDMQINAEATGFLLEHCRDAKAALVMSSVTVYKPHPDPWHPRREDEALGDMLAHVPASYPLTKIASEGIARFCARSYGLPVTIARMNSAYNERGGLIANHMKAIAEGRPVTVRHDPLPYSPIHGEDIAAQVGALLGAASVPATIVNWCGDEAVSVQDWCRHIAEVLGTTADLRVAPFPGASVGSVQDPAKRRAITGPCQVSWREGVRRVAEVLYPDRIQA